MTTILRARVAHTPRDPFERDDALETFDDGAVAFDGETIVATGEFAARAARDFADAEVLDRRDCILLPGFVDTHVHFPQIAVIGAMGLQLLDWLAQRTLPEEARMADAGARAPHGRALRPRAGAQRHDVRARLRRAFPGRAGGAVRGGRAAPGCGSRAGSWSRTATCGPTSRSRPSRPTSAARVARALARPRSAALRRHAALLGLVQRGDARRLPRAAGRPACCSPATSTRARARSTSCASCSPRRATTSTRTSAPGCWANARCSRTTCTSPTTSCGAWRRRAPRSRTARRRTRSWPRASSRWRATSSTACASGWAPTSAPEPG